jgi:hypothetical protein
MLIMMITIIIIIMSWLYRHVEGTILVAHQPLYYMASWYLTKLTTGRLTGLDRCSETKSRAVY